MASLNDRILEGGMLSREACSAEKHAQQRSMLSRGEACSAEKHAEVDCSRVSCARTSIIIIMNGGH